MRIARVRLTGFKSFVDPCEFSIMPGLTGVVGPNGCGKSNLLEAIRWVMGEGSAKSLRGAAMDDVIFAGTASRPQRQFAEVSILADREDDEVEVVRRIERGAGSAYRINGRDARARDAQLIFADAATGAHSPALVSQGRIGAIIAARPAERRAMLEEAAGISGLHVRRREAEMRLKATEANLVRARELAAEQDAKIAALRRQARSAERYRTLSDDIRIAEGRLIYARWRDAAAAADAARAEAKIADEAVFAASEAQRVAAALANDATGALAVARAAAQVARDDAADARHRLATVEAERTAIDARIADIAGQSRRLAVDRAREDELARDAIAALDRLTREAETLDMRLTAASADRPALAHALANAEAQSRAAEASLASAMAKAAHDSAERRVAEAALATATVALERALTAHRRVSADIVQLGDAAPIEAQRDAAAATRRAAEADAKASADAIEAAEAIHATAVHARAIAETEAVTASAVLTALAAEAAALASDVREASGALSQVRAAPGYETALAAALADDLYATVGETGARHWAGAVIGADDPVLAVGEPLCAHVTAPDALARRLSQIAVVDVDDGAQLAVGQRVVTKDGRMRRWDGFASHDTGAAAAERLKRRNRLSAIDAQLSAAERAAQSAEATRSAAATALTDAAQRVTDARCQRDAAEAALRSAIRGEDQAALAFDRATARAAELNTRVAVTEEELAAARRGHEVATKAMAALPADQTGGIIRALEAAAQGARETVVTLRAQLAARDGQGASDKARRAATLAKAGEVRTATRETRAAAQARAEQQDLRRVEMGRVAGERFECPAAMLPEKLAFQAASVGAASDESARLDRASMDRERLGPVNLVAQSELAEIEAGRAGNGADIVELTEAVNRLRGSIGNLNREGRTRLRTAFEAVDGHFRALIATLFDGGEAHLALIDSDDPLEAGLEIMVQPPGKKLSSLTLLSGGEQALTAVALIFALFLTIPAPLCVLDEVDAPLDDANVERFCDLLDAMTRETDTRYLIVTHNAVTMSRMHRLYGVTMVEQGISRLVSVDLGGAEALLAAE